MTPPSARPGSATISRTRRPVPTGTVEFVTNTSGLVAARATCSAAAKT